jgi:hypothetical protein
VVDHRLPLAHEDPSEATQADPTPEVLAINGKAELVVQEAAAYQRLLENTGNGPRKSKIATERK